MMEERELHKHLERLNKQMQIRLANIEGQQKIIAKSFHERLNRSVVLAGTHEDLAANFKSNRRTIQTTNQSRVNKSKAENDERTTDSSSPSLMLRQWNQNFSVPYRKEYSFRPGLHTNPSKVLEVRCKMWQKVADFCAFGRERARSAPPRLRELRAPEHVERAHSHALELVGIQKWLVQTPSRQPIIDLDTVRKWREKEKTLACGAVEEFVSSLNPYRLKPGPSQRVHDVNSLYCVLSSSPASAIRSSWS